jgi:hypothetical protein
MRTMNRQAMHGVTRESLVEALGNIYTSWFSDSSETDFQLHLKWPCGCNARRLGLVQRLWNYGPCEAHRPPANP